MEFEFQILFNILDFESNLSECHTFLESFSEGKGAAVPIFEVIDRLAITTCYKLNVLLCLTIVIIFRQPVIDSSSDEGFQKNSSLQGNIEFRNVHFRIPLVHIHQS